MPCLLYDEIDVIKKIIIIPIMKALCEKCPDGGFMNELGLC
jgi:hypothetical protein